MFGIQFLKFETKTEGTEQSQSHRNARSQTETRCSIHEAINSRRRDLPHIRIPLMATPFPHPDSRRLYQPRGLAQRSTINADETKGRCRDPRAPSPRPPAAFGQRKKRRLLPAPRSRGSRRSSAAAAGSSPAAPCRSHSPASPRRPPPMPMRTTRRRRRPCCSQIPSRASQHPPRRASQIRGSARTARHCSAPAPTPRRRRLGAGGRVRDASVGAKRGDLGRCTSSSHRSRR